MIIEFKFKNVLSFKDWTVLDFRATKDKDLKDYGVVNLGKDSLCKMAVIYGANASGKSNLLKVFDYLDNIVNSDRSDKEEKIGIYPFLLDDETKDAPSEFEILFYSNSVKYLYKLKADSNQVHYEVLYYYPSVKPKMIFERKTENGVSHITFNKDIKIEDAVKKEIEAKCLKNLSVFKAYQKTNIKNELIENAIVFFNSFNYLPLAFKPNFKIPNFQVEFLFNNLLRISDTFTNIIYSEKEHILEFLKNADFNIVDLIFEKKELNIQNKNYEYHTIKSFLHQVKKGNDYLIKELPLSLQSEGTQKIIYFCGFIFSLIKNENNPVVLVDELENSIHPLLLKHFIKKIIETDSKIQIISTIHYDPLLEWDEIIRKDFIWFTSRRENGSTELYPLTDFKGLNRISNLKKAYIYGNFGAVPEIKEE